MGAYQRQVLPRLQDKMMNTKSSGRSARERAGLHGRVVEIGFGTGLNAAYYPPEVTKVYAVEPSNVCMRLAELKLRPWHRWSWLG